MVTFLRWLRALTLIAVTGVMTFFVFSHPPMRLMPPPLLFQDTGPEIVQQAVALGDGSRIEVFCATSHLPVGPRDSRI